MAFQKPQLTDLPSVSPYVIGKGKNSMSKICLLMLVVICTTFSCTWVKPTETGAQVVVAEPFNISQCDRISTLTTSVKHTIGSMDRKAEKVKLELVTLARNEAALRNGDTIVARGPVADGSMTFDVYRCDNS